MARFILIDHALRDVGGHQYQYALDVLAASEEAGFEPVLASHRDLQATDRFPCHWRTRSLFDCNQKVKHWAGEDGKSTRPVGTEGDWLDTTNANWLTRCLDAHARRQRVDYLRKFEEACSRLFAELGWNQDDVVFLPTVSEFDLLGLVRFLKQCPQSVALDWHLQFHFNIFRGREPEHDQQIDRKQLFQRQIGTALRQVPEHRVHFYATTESIARQYRRLQVKDVQWLPYPVNPGLHQQQEQEDAPPQRAAPLRITCAGTPRREKGKHAYAKFINGIWDILQSGSAQLVLQADPRRIRRYLPKKAKQQAAYTEDPATDSNANLVIVKYPLSAENYLKLIRHSDIALFLYDSQRYHSRASGVLLEMLAAGVPVIVPAGCWLADQIQEPIYEHLDALHSSIEANTPSVALGGQTPHSVAPDDRISFGGGGHEACFESATPADTSDLLLSFAWREADQGTYIRIQLQQFDRSGAELDPPRIQILGSRQGKPIRWLAPITATTARIRLTISNAYHDHPATIQETGIQFIPKTGPSSGRPMGRVGLIAANLAQVPALLSELQAHYAHYRRTALDFADHFGPQHAPSKTVNILAESSNPPASRDQRVA